VRVGLCCALAADEANLAAAIASASAELAWTTRDELALGRAFDAEPPHVVVVAHGGAIDGTRAVRALGRDVPVIIALAEPAHASEVFGALARGHVEVTPIPRARGGNDTAELARTLRRHARNDSVRPHPAQDARAPLLALAASAGGPEALATVLGDLSSEAAVRVLVAQHIDAPFVAGLAAWLAQRTGRRVEVAEEGTILGPEAIRVVRSDRQPTVDTRGAIRYVAADPKQPFHPSFDTLFESMARAGLRGVAVLLTGMGQDGARGLLGLRTAGWTTIAQDAQSSRIYGMPREAARLGAASEILPLDRIGAAASLALTRVQVRR